MLFFYWLLVTQIVLESFPISSSAHCLLLETVIKNFLWNPTTRYSIPFLQSHLVAKSLSIDVINHFIHGPTVLIIALFFFKEWSWMLMHWRRCWRIIVKIIVFTFSADVMTALFFITLNNLSYPFYSTGIGLLITTILLFSLRYCPDSRRSSWNFKKALIIGIAQGVALLPGISRMAITYVTARWLAIAPHKAFSISLLIQWPLIAAAFLNSVRVLGYSNMCEFLNMTVIILLIFSTVLAWYALRFVAYVNKANRWWMFSLYMIVPLAVWLFLFITLR